VLDSRQGESRGVLVLYHSPLPPSDATLLRAEHCEFERQREWTSESETTPLLRRHRVVTDAEVVGIWPEHVGQ
jgi:hypothetical protein